MNDVTAIIISFLRPAYTIACIESLKKTYPDIQIIVGENGEYNNELAQVCRTHQARYIELPFDSGVCIGRNTLMQHVETEYVLVGDDDFFFEETTGVDKMVALISGHPEIDLIGGRVIQDGVVRNYQGKIERFPRHIITHPINLETADYQYDRQSGLRFIKTDLTFNFFVARVDKIKDIPWDEEIKVAYEHESWFIDLQEANRNVYFSPDPIVIHKPAHIRNIVEKSDIAPTYAAYRMRRTDKERFFTRHNLDYVIDMHGTKDYAPNHVSVKKKNDVKYVDFCITTFERPQAVRRLLLSIARYYPHANVYVADQSKEFDREFYKTLRGELYDAGLVKRVSIERLPYDCGLSYARNHLVTTTPNKYKLILDDDMEFGPGTDIGKMVSLFETDRNIGIVGGRVEQLGHDVHFEFTPEVIQGTIYHRTEKKIWKTHMGVTYRKTGCVLNFALMRRELFNTMLWDPALKVTEHTDFYLRMKVSHWKILYTPDVVIGHPPVERDAHYKEFRTRDEFLKRMFKKHGANRVVYENGQTVEVMPDGSISRYKSEPKPL